MQPVPAVPQRWRNSRDEISLCTSCPRLVAWRQEAAAKAPRAFAGEEYWARPLGGFGDDDARLVLVGLAPAAHGGNRTGRMFTGDRSGDFLFAALWRAGFANQPESRHLGDGLELKDAYVTAAVRCAPPDNKPAPEERDRCRPFLEPRAVAARGCPRLPRARRLRLRSTLEDAGDERTGDSVRTPARRPHFTHGLEIELGAQDHPRWLLCSYHPSQRNVFTGLLTPAMFDAVLRRAVQLLSSS